jgi:hypothetical protein
LSKRADGQLTTRNFNPRDLDAAIHAVRDLRTRQDFKSARLYAELEEWTVVK